MNKYAIFLGFIFLRGALFGQIPAEFAVHQDAYSLVRVCDSAFSPADFGLDAEGMNFTGNCSEFPAAEATITAIRQRGFSVEILIGDLEKFYEARAETRPEQETTQATGFRLGSMGGYPTFAEILADLARMREQYPEAVSAPIHIGQSIEQRPIFAWRISLAPEGDSVPETLFTALHHAREPGSATALLYFLWNILENSRQEGSEANLLLNNRAVWCVPVVNPDGYEFNRANYPNGGGLWRKNRRANGTTFGVDLNRNYGPLQFWNAPNGGSSEKPGDDTYRGAEPFSEPETRAMRDFIASRRFRAALNYHTYGNVCIYPFSHALAETPDSALYRRFAAEITRDNRFSIGRDVETLGYAIRGGSDDYFYANGILSATPESGAISDGFWAKPERIMPLAADNLHANYQAAWSAGVNIRPVEVLTEWLNDSIVKIRVVLANVGRQEDTTGRSARISFANSAIIPRISEQKLPQLAPGDIDTLTWECEVRNTLSNATSVGFLLETGQEGITRRDSLRVSIIQAEHFPLFTTANDTSNWAVGTWGVEQNDDGFTFADSPYGFYKPSTLNIARFSTPLDLHNKRAASLSFLAKWKFAYKNDAAVVQVSTTGGRRWECLECSRTRSDVELPDSLGGRAGAAFRGNFPLWERQICPLDSYIGKQILLRLAVASSPGNVADGIAVRDVTLEQFPAEIPNEREIFTDVAAEIFPSPALGSAFVSVSLRTGQLPYGATINVQVFTPAGVEVFGNNILASGGNETAVELPVQNWSSGVYIVYIATQGVVLTGKLAVMR